MGKSAVKTVKKVIKKANKDRTDHSLVNLDHRNTTSEGMKSSPAQRLMSRQTRTLLPSSEKLLKPKLAEGVRDKKRKVRTKEAFYYNRNPHDLLPLKMGDKVHIQPTQPQGGLEESYYSEADSCAILQSPHRGWFCPQTK